MFRISIIIPTYNEAKNLPILVEEIFNSIDKENIDCELIIVDDGSPDGTGDVANHLAQDYPIRVIHREGKQGLGSAVRAGFTASDREHLGVMDADLSHDPIILNKLAESLSNYDIAIGSRFEDGSVVEQWKWWRRLISEVGVFFTRLFTGVKDPLSGFFFLKRSVIDNVDLDTVGYKILLEILVKGNYKSTKEIPFCFRIRKFSTSKLDKKEYWLFLKQIIQYSWYKLYKKFSLLNFKKWLLDNKFLLAILLLITGLLLYKVSYRTFWMDETMVLGYLDSSLWGFIIDYFKNPDNHPPLYYFFVLLVSKVLPSGELMVRLVSILAGLGIVSLVYIFTKRITGSKSYACFASFFTGFSSYFVLVSQMARYHSLAGFSSLLAIYFFYKLYFEDYKNRSWYYFLASLIFVGYVDYPHFIYVILVTSGLFLYSIVRGKKIMSFLKWLKGHFFVGILCSPMLWFVYHRVAIQGDGGWDKMNLLSNSWINIVGGVVFHFYSFFFGQNIFPWNYIVFLAGSLVMLMVLVGLVLGIKKKRISAFKGHIIFLTFAFIVLNTLFMNVANPRYNFIVYPKFGFVAYPLLVMSFVFIIKSFNSKKVQIILFVLWGVVSFSGLFHFYNVDNYMNASFFRTFESFEYVRDNSKDGEYLAITPDAGIGVYKFYKNEYFQNLKPLQWDEILSAEKGSLVWFFATGSDGGEESVNTEDVIPDGYEIMNQFDSVPLDVRFKELKEKVLHRPSYKYKYTVFLIKKI